MKTRLTSTSIIILIAVFVIVACLLLLTLRRPDRSVTQNTVGAEQEQLKHYHESLDLLLRHTLALQTNLSTDNIEQFRSCYTYFLGRSNFPKSWTCVQAKVNEIHRILESIFDAHIKNCNSLIQDLESLPSTLLHDSNTQSWKTFDMSRRKVEQVRAKVLSLATLTRLDTKYPIKSTMDTITSQYALKLSSASPVFVDKAQLEQWIKLLPLTISDKAVLKSAENGARRAFQQGEEWSLIADSTASDFVDKLKSYTPANSTDRATRLNHFQSFLPSLDDVTKFRLSVSMKAQLDRELLIAEVKFLSSEALLAMKQVLENGRNRSFGDLPISYLPEYIVFFEKWNNFPDKQQVEYLLRPLQIQNGKLGQLKVKLCVREMIQYCEVTGSSAGSCWRLCTCLVLQHQWETTYRNQSEEIGDEFGLVQDLKTARGFAEQELLGTVETLEKIQSNQVSQRHCPGPGIADLRQIVMFSYLLPEQLHTLLKRIMELRAVLGWGSFDFKLACQLK